MSNRDDCLSNEDLPPPYSPAAGLSANYPSPQGGSSVPYSQSSLFSSQLASLHSQIAAEQAARTSARDERDGYVLSLVVPYVEDLLLSISGIHPPPTLVEATMIPDGAVGKEWQLSDEDDKRRGEVRKLIRVVEESKMIGDRKPSQASKDFDHSSWQADESDRPSSQSGPTLWWENEAMARRLARHLQPEPSASLNSRPMVNVREEVREKAGKKASRWSLFKRDEPTEKSRSLQGQPTTPASLPGSTTQQPSNRATMSAKAEEVTFRRENELGIWETRTGWGIVIRVRIQNV